jgi:hypothetical protein
MNDFLHRWQRLGASVQGGRGSARRLGSVALAAFLLLWVCAQPQSQSRVGDPRQRTVAGVTAEATARVVDQSVQPAGRRVARCIAIADAAVRTVPWRRSVAAHGLPPPRAPDA